MIQIQLIQRAEFQRVEAAGLEWPTKLALLADMCRANTLATVKKAGSGHLGTSFSALDIMILLYYRVMNTVERGFKHPERDVFFSSKGHDAPGLYSVLFALGVLPEDQFVRLRRIGGTYGHPDVRTPGVEANTGSLGMGISKGKGILFAKKLQGHGGRVFVMTGDGELQEGQIYESLQTAAHQRLSQLVVIVDHNKVQSDKRVAEIMDLGDLEAKFEAFGWSVARCDGHDLVALDGTLNALLASGDRPKALIADTIKGRGVSFMEHPTALKANSGLYRWHAGAPDDESFAAAYSELIARIRNRFQRSGLGDVRIVELPQDQKSSPVATKEFVVEAFGDALVEIGESHPEIVVLDADLSADCRLRKFERRFPERFIENGIAEQDMVSMAGALARNGFLPVVSSFAAFLAARANEQIYNNGCEGSRIIYGLHYAGIIPAGPGQSHQSLRDISLLGALPHMVIIQPCNAAETRLALRFAVEETTENCALRLVIGPSPRHLELPSNYSFVLGRGTVLREGSDAVLFAYGPVMINEALAAAEKLAEGGVELKLVNMPWLNRMDREWLADVAGTSGAIYVLEDHSPIGGLGDFLLSELVESRLLGDRVFHKFGVDDYPACGTPGEVLQFHRLDGGSLAERIALDLARV